jgi:biopolymer transport protein TolQ
MEPLHQAAQHAPYELSVMALFMQADWVVKLVMLGLVVASIWCWAVILNRVAVYARTQRAIKTFETAFAAQQPLYELEKRFAALDHGLAPIFASGFQEWQQSVKEKALAADGIRSRISLVVELALTQQSQSLQSRLPILATVGSAAPFIGLFGTVWGIMNAFTAIAASKDTSLAVVAPGIAEALFATALGLLAAIPAVIAFNKLSADAARLTAQMESFADRYMALISRKIDAGETV